MSPSAQSLIRWCDTLYKPALQSRIDAHFARQPDLLAIATRRIFFNKLGGGCEVSVYNGDTSLRKTDSGSQITQETKPLFNGLPYTDHRYHKQVWNAHKGAEWHMLLTPCMVLLLPFETNTSQKAAELAQGYALLLKRPRSTHERITLYRSLVNPTGRTRALWDHAWANGITFSDPEGVLPGEIAPTKGQ